MLGRSSTARSLKSRQRVTRKFLSQRRKKEIPMVRQGVRKLRSLSRRRVPVSQRRRREAPEVSQRRSDLDSHQ
jgi:hypothetical protein